jgi:outer membrane autotransporter protein
LLDGAVSFADGPLADILTRLDLEPSASGRRQILNAINPAVYTELANLSEARLSDINAALDGRLNTISMGSMNLPEENGIYAWSTAYGSSQVRVGEQELGTPGYTTNASGNVSGIEKRLGSLTLGLSGAAGVSSATCGFGMGSVRTDSWLAGLYGSLPVAGLTLDGALGYGNSDSRVLRSGNFLGGSGTIVDLADSEWLAEFGASLPFELLSMQVTPSARFYYTSYRQSSVRENGTGTGMNAAIRQAFFHSESLRVGLQLSRMWNAETRPVRLSVSGDWLHRQDQQERSSLDIGATDLPGQTQPFVSSRAGLDSFRMGFSLEVALTHSSTLRANVLRQNQSGQKTTNASLSIGVEF